MSFLDIDVEAQKGAVFQNANEERSKVSLIIGKASNLLSDFASGVSNLERLVDQLGTKRDGKQLRQTIESARLVELNEYKQQLEHLTNDISHLIANNSQTSIEDKFSEEKVRKEFESVNNNFNILKRQYNERKNSVIINDRISNQEALDSEENIPSSSATENTPLIQRQQQQQNQYTITQQELDLHSVLAEERAEEIKKIHGGVEEINSIYKQLGYLVQQQGGQVDTVENNMSNLANHTQNAAQELVKADNYQKQKRKWSCIILIVLVIVVLIAVLAIFS
ncbi:Syntaxin-7 [Wickerhamomyces ciferrii]|uniref:Syntaxin-7 n=1 Tax=Wickerhamomyces ciferrii (strain ATCC 14091 / BCRC 22168 / CBS 111 / JCM 3599 / NBRC 0793 / NRRL Y-1031 F-60-10) TaxID=1206466 RepID=K0KG03_WICCF|nr:Syntaxin-7 [Wickerhamomyces ciferrii]CCH41856.1 Syntaxin-7 [Wickerhamomyces ciferrii]